LEERGLTLRTEAAGGEVRVTVSDRGTGIAADMRDRLFSPFTTSKSGGVGMGLALCQSIVAAHGGRLTGANNPEGGATFSFTLPVREGP
jgi:C4-dicarboxylate-specific signal transduction histidine kinase